MYFHLNRMDKRMKSNEKGDGVNNGEGYPELSRRPFKVMENRVWRTYTGGMMIERWQGIENPEDGNLPEEWVASTVNARNAGREHILNEGLSKIRPDNGQELTLKEIIQSNPEMFLGKQHVDKYGDNLAVLVKVLDAKERLSIQVHPDRHFAKEAFRSDFGKTEAWYVLGGREVDGEKPYVLMGFKPDVSRQQWEKAFHDQDIEGMINCLHKIPVEEGEVFLIEGGVPHAIGPGCFMIEIQEPTDYTLRVERTNNQGKELPDFLCHQGIGFQNMLNCFHYETYDYTETLRRWKVQTVAKRQDQNGEEVVLIGEDHTDRFRMEQLSVISSMVSKRQDEFYIAVIVSGDGIMDYGEGKMEIKTSDQIFVPEGAGDIKWINIGKKDLQVVLCRPPL